MRTRTSLAAAAALLTWAASTASAQPKFAIEVEGGRNVGLTPYLRNVVYTEEDVRGGGSGEDRSFQPFLANERSGWGTGLEVRLVSENLQGGLSMRWFDVGTARVHHRGTAPGHPDGELRRTRIRTDGTVDDAGVEYDAIDDPAVVSLGPSREANLFVFGAEGGYRFYLYSGDFQVFTPVVGSIVLTYLGRDFAPLRPGLGVESGVSVAFDFVSVMSIVLGGRLHGMATPTYWSRADAARRAAELGQPTESALFSTQLSTSLNLSLQFTIR